MIGCGGQDKLPADDRARFCDVEEKRKFSEEEIIWRTKNAPWNLKRDFKTNKTWDRECTVEG